MSDLMICRVMGWTLEELDAIPADVYSVLVDHLPALAAVARA